jgi:predicted transcriptional regulator
VTKGRSGARAGCDDLREVLLTLSAREFDSFARDLKLLREHCAESNTQAIVKAVRQRAEGVRVLVVEERKVA